jgi:ribosomal protein S18 acetylase RimI-like enzyme
MISLRLATVADLPTLWPRTLAFQATESIDVHAGKLESALRQLLGNSALGGVWLIQRGDAVIGYAMVTLGFDLEFAGHDGYLTEFWIDPEERGRGAGTSALELLEAELLARGVGALHLMVRPDNAALRLYHRAGFETSPRIFMTRRLR